MKHIFIVNPISGGGKTKKMIPFIHEYFAAHDEAYEIYITEYVSHAFQISRMYFPADDVTLYSVGGDGTAHEILNGLNEGVIMAIVPLGSGNDYYRSIAAKTKDMRELLREIIDGKTVQVDYGVNGTERFINCANMGLDATVNDWANKIGNKIGFLKPLAYVISALILVIRPKVIELTYTCDHQEKVIKTILTSIMMGSYYGGGFKGAPSALLTDGLFNVYVVEPMSFFRIIHLFPLYFLGKHEGMRGVNLIQTDYFQFKTDKPVDFGMDGEISVVRAGTCVVVKRGLNLKIPRSSIIN